MDNGRPVGLLGNVVGGEEGGGNTVGNESDDGRHRTVEGRSATRGYAAHDARQRPPWHGTIPNPKALLPRAERTCVARGSEGLWGNVEK